MKSKYILLFCFASTLLMSQSMTKIKLAANDIIMNEIVSMSVYGSLGPTPGSKICGINCSNTTSNHNEILLFPYYDQTDISKGIFIYHKEGNLYINKLLHISYDEVFFLGTYNNTGSVNLMAFGIYSVKLKTIKAFKVVSLASDPNFILNPVDVIYSNNSFYILAGSLIDYLSNYNSKIVLIKLDGTNILWSNIYNSVAPIHSEAPRSIALAPNGNLLVAGTIKRFGDTAPRMMLAQFDTDGNPVLMKSIELMSADLSYNQRYGWTYVKSKGTNIHLFSQAIIGASEPGSVLVTMFDNDFNLKTWRNYTAPIRVESANIDGNFFLFGGQAPIESGYEGFALMKVNSLNAIVEQFKNFKQELKNANVATSSASVYDRASDKIWTVIKPNGSIENQIVLLENPSVLNHRCGDDLISSVAKDPMQLTEIPLNSKPLQFQLSDIDGNIRETNFLINEICSATGSNNPHQDEILLFPNPITNGFKITSKNSILKIAIYGYKGIKIYQQNINSESFNFNSDLEPGIYFVQLTLKDRASVVKKIIVK